MPTPSAQTVEALVLRMKKNAELNSKNTTAIIWQQCVPWCVRYVQRMVLSDIQIIDICGRQTVMGCLHDPANVQQTSSKCIQNTHANAARLLKVCWKFAGRLLDRVNTL